jgi:hypothetical protein
MEAPRCIVCGQRHWSREPCPAMAQAIAEEQNQIRANPRSQSRAGLATKAVTKIPDQPVTKITEIVTQNPISVTPPNPGSSPGQAISVTNSRDAQPPPSGQARGQASKRGRPRSLTPSPKPNAPADTALASKAPHAHSLTKLLESPYSKFSASQAQNEK